MRGFCTAMVLLAAIGAGIFAFAAFDNAQSAVHEIEALICVLIVTVALVGGMIAGAIDEAAKRIVQAPSKPEESK